jgi:hypothetical protein
MTGAGCRRGNPASFQRKLVRPLRSAGKTSGATFMHALCFKWMKMLTLLICGMLLVGCSKQAASKESIEPGSGLGGVRLGMTTDELRTQLGTPNQTIGPDRNGRSALSYPGGFSAVSDSNSLIVSVQAGKNFRGRTKEGIGIGSSKADVIHVFGIPDKTEPNSDTSATIYYTRLGLRMKIGTNENVEHITVRPKGSA